MAAMASAFLTMASAYHFKKMSHAQDNRITDSDRSLLTGPSCTCLMEAMSTSFPSKETAPKPWRLSQLGTCLLQFAPVPWRRAKFGHSWNQYSHVATHVTGCLEVCLKMLT